MQELCAATPAMRLLPKINLHMAYVTFWRRCNASVAGQQFRRSADKELPDSGQVISSHGRPLHNAIYWKANAIMPS